MSNSNRSFPNMLSDTFDDGAFVIQEHYPPAGIYVLPSPAVTAAYALGNRVTVTGNITYYNVGLLAITPDSVVSVRGAGVPAPEHVRPAAVGSANQGRLIQVNGRVSADGIMDDEPYGRKMTLVDVQDSNTVVHVYLYNPPNFNVSQFTPNTLLSVTGFSSYYVDHAELWPRMQSDFNVRHGPSN